MSFDNLTKSYNLSTIIIKIKEILCLNVRNKNFGVENL
jgi:hypothetical protein